MVLAQLLAIALVVAVVALAIALIPPRRGGVPVSIRDRKRRPRDDERGWKGFIYANPDDPHLFVPKRIGPGYTLNFGHRGAWKLLFAVLGVIALGITLSTLQAHPSR
jgi:uncharacterized membrane protein